MLRSENWDLQSDSVQDCWNEFESKLVKMVNMIVPLTEFSNNTFVKAKIPLAIKNLISVRRQLLMKLKQQKSNGLKI